MRNYFLIILAIFILQSTNGIAQSTFEKAFVGDLDFIYYYPVVEQTFDSCFILGTSLYNFSTQSLDWFLIKIDSLGDTLWTQSFGVGYDDFLFNVIQSSDSGFILVGSVGFNCMMVAKTDQTGIIVWNKCLLIGESDKCYSLLETSDGGYIIAGETNRLIGPSWGDNIFVVKMDSNGDTLWTKLIGAGSSGNEARARSIIEDSDGNFILTGSVTINPGPDDENLLLVKLNSGGDTIWTKNYGQGMYDIGTSVIEKSDSTLLILGNTINIDTISDTKTFLLKTDLSGDSIWSRTYSNFDNNMQGLQLSEMQNGKNVVSGSGSSSFLMNVDDQGDTLFTQTYSYIGRVNSFQGTADNGFILGCGGQGFIACIKTDSVGNVCSSGESSITSLPFMTSIPEYHELHVFSTEASISSNTLLTSKGCYFSDSCNTLNITDQQIIESDVVEIYPNPTCLNFRINLKNQLQITSIAVFDVYGNLVLSDTKNLEGKLIDVSSFESGIYFIELNVNANIFVIKLIKV